MTKIKQAAIQDDTGKVWTLPRGNRHHDIMRVMSKAGIKVMFTNTVQGFILDDSDETFVNRREAAEIAFKCGETKTNVLELYSEDLW